MLEVGTEVAGYRIDGILGRGGMGVVYEATQLSLDRKVALKLIVPELGEDESLKERFRREALRQAAVDHPNIVTVHEAGETAEGLFFAMRLVRGPTLNDMIVSRELDVGRSLRILAQVADALDTAHAAGLIHRDIKPNNILVGGRDHAYLADFGLTRAVGDTRLTRSGQFVGTLDYVSPEQIKGESVTARSDVYSLAAVLYECMTGLVPYPKDSEAAVLYAHLSLPPPKLSEQRPDLPTQLDKVLARAMAKDPETRYATAGEMVQAAEETFGRGLRAVMRPPGPLERAEETGIRRAEEQVSTVETPQVTAPQSTAVAAPTRRASPPEAETRRARRRTGPARRQLIAVTAAAAIALAAVGYAIGHSGEDADTAARVSAGPLRIELPADWKRTPTVPRIPGLSLTEASNVAPETDVSTSLLAGTASGSGATLLPPAFERNLERRPATDDVVKLGDTEAYRYRGLNVRGLGTPLTVFVAPMQTRVATLVCVGATGSTHARECERTASTLQFDDTEPLPLGARKEYAQALERVLAKVSLARRTERNSLTDATTAARQARAARALAEAYRSAARDVRGLPTGPAERPATADLEGATRRTASAYRKLASAAQATSSAEYDSASNAVRQSERRFDRALDRLGRLGYRVQ